MVLMLCFINLPLSAQATVIWKIGESDNTPGGMALAPDQFNRFVEDDFGYEDRFFLMAMKSPSDAFAPFVVHYVETFIVPAIVGEYTVRPHGASEGKEIGTIKAYIRTINLSAYRLD